MKGIMDHELSSFLERDAESMAFQNLQMHFQLQYEEGFHDPIAKKTIVIIPSLTLDADMLEKLEGAIYYEERLLCMLMLLKMPRTHLVYVTSVPIDPIVVDYYLHQLPGITNFHANQRLSLLSCYDPGHQSLTEKILSRPRLIERIRERIPQDHFAHMACFVVTDQERSLALKLNLPIYGCDPNLADLGNKTNSRRIFKDCGLQLADGFEDLHTETEVAQALGILKTQNPNLKKAVIKLNEGFSGDGNAVFFYPETVPEFEWSSEFLQNILPAATRLVADDLNYGRFMEKIEQMGGIVEAFVEGEWKESPSVQCRITPFGDCEVISTHDQILGGEGGQVFLGAHFPAHPDYAGELAGYGIKVAEKLRDAGVLGRFGVDFISVKTSGGWEHFAIEINLRKGGTTHPFLLLNFLTEGKYNPEQGQYITLQGKPRYYFCSDNLKEPELKGLIPQDLIEIAMLYGLLYDSSRQEGVFFHLIGALSPFGKIGVVCIGESPEAALVYYQRTREILVKEGAKRSF